MNYLVSSCYKFFEIAYSEIFQIQEFYPENDGEGIQEMLKNYFESELEGDVGNLRKDIVTKYPQLQHFIDIIRDPETKDELRSELINAIYVLAGIKPILVIEENTDANIFKIIETFHHSFQKLKFVKTHEGDYYLINETPLYDFDPRRFIDKFNVYYKNLEEAVIFAFPNQSRLETDKLLSYLLGFGPTWEGFAGIPRLSYIKSNKQLSIFSEEHYFQLGEVICKTEHKNMSVLSREEAIEKGKSFSLNLAQYPWPRNSDMINNPLKEAIEISKLYMIQIIDPISYQTSYIQRGILYRQKLLALLELKENCSTF